MTSPLSLDHVGIMGSALGPMGAAYRRLGFRLTEPSQHHGARTPGGPVEPWGTGNQCAMLAEGYVELLAVVDPDLFDNRLQAHLERYVGAHIIAFGCEDAVREAARMAGESLASGVARLERPIGEGDTAAVLKFDLVRLDQGAVPEGRVLIIEHLTRELLWRPDDLDHPNGAVAFAGVSVVVADVAARARTYARIFGVTPELAPGVAEFRLAKGRFRLVEPDRARERGLPPSPCLPHVAEIEIGVRDLGATRALLASSGVVSTDDAASVLVPPEEAGGIACRFVAAPAPQ